MEIISLNYILVFQILYFVHGWYIHIQSIIA